MTTQTNQEVQVENSAGRRPFAAFLQDQRKGVLHNDLGEALAELVAAVVETGKKGTLTLKLDVALNKDGDTLLIADTVSVKEPKHDTKPSIFFADDGGNLTRHNPRQPELPLRKVEGGKDNDNAAAAAGEAG